MEHKLSLLQQKQLEVLREFVRICELLSLRYYLVAGTMLGAVRHHGFIPWDDDIDVAMPRRDYELFLEKAPDCLDTRFELADYSDPQHLWMTAILSNREKEFVLNNAANKINTGAWIDILMIDGAPGPGLKRECHYIVYKFYRMLFQLSHFSKIVNIYRDRPWYEKAIMKFAEMTGIEKHLDSVKIAERLHKILSKCDFDSADFAATYVGAYGKKEIVPKEYYGEGRRYNFEGLAVRGVEEYDLYLKALYGDYMKIPPENERGNKHNVSRRNS